MEKTIEILFDLEREARFSESLSEQNAFCFRAKWRAIRLANCLLNEEGEIQNLEETINLLEKKGYILASKSYNDSEITDHFLTVLKNLQSSPSLKQQLRRFGLPVFDNYVEDLICLILNIERELKDRDVIWVLLSSLLCPLRQSVGSCFATSPAILVHEEQMGQYLQDMEDLLYKGKLTRIFGGEEFTVPISPSPGIGELKKKWDPDYPPVQEVVDSFGFDPINPEGRSYLEVLEKLFLDHFHLKKNDLSRQMPKFSEKIALVEEMKKTLELTKWKIVAFSDHLLLKVWEFTIASFVDVKTEFSKWNLFSSLGLFAEERGGIGELIFQHLQRKLEEANEKLAHYQEEYEVAFDQVRATERLFKGATTEADLRRLKGEHQTRVYHMHACLDLRDKWNRVAENISNFFSFLIDQIIAKFKEYFQEIYDAEMQEVGAVFYDDSPAGFRLLYKHGRAHVGSWTFIHNREEYVTALKDFFLAIENALIESCEWEEGKQEISHLITAIIHHIAKEEFLISAFQRMGRAHRIPLHKWTLADLDRMEKKPWAYTSGGTMPTLLKTYFRREGTLSEEARWVESPQDLLIFLIETLKGLPPSITDSFLKDPQKRMLMTSPTHAFSLLPGREFFKEGWLDTGFTYTWVRDQIFLPGEEFYASIRLDQEDQLYLIQAFAQRLPLLEGHEFQKSYDPTSKKLKITEFRKKLPPFPQIDSFLYEMLPLISPEEVKEIFSFFNLKHPLVSHPLGRREVHDLIISKLDRCHPIDQHKKTRKIMEEKNLSPPKPLIFADSNWAKYYFAFLVNPANGELELWRVDKEGITGAPMREWEPYLNGTIKETWGIYIRPYEYTA